MECAAAGAMGTGAAVLYIMDEKETPGTGECKNESG